MHAVEETKAIERKYWLNFQDLKILSDEVFCLLTVMEWLNYESYENLDVALTFELEIVTDQIENKLQLPELANALVRAKEIQKFAYEKYVGSKGIENYIKATNQLREDKDYQKSEKVFEVQRPLLIDRLYELVTTNIEKFP